MVQSNPGEDATSSLPDESHESPEEQAGIPKKSSRWRRATKGVLSGTIAGLISGALVSFSLTPTGQAAKSLISHPTTPPSCSNPEWLLPVPDSQIFATSFYFAPDTLGGYNTPAHTADLTVDGSENTAWLQWWPTAGFHDANPRYNRIYWGFPVAYNLRLVCIVNGWTESAVTYKGTEPIRKATINFGQATCHHYDKMLSNKGFTHTWQPVKVSCKTRNVYLFVDSTYNAVTFNGAPPDCVLPPLEARTTHCTGLTGISEVRFYYSPEILSGITWSAPTKQK